MSGKKSHSDCDKDSIVHDHPHKHSLLCDHHAYYDEKRQKVVYRHGDEFHENCENGHTHQSPLGLKGEFARVANPDVDCSTIKEAHVHIRDDGVAEVHQPPAENAPKKKKTCTVISELKPLT